MTAKLGLFIQEAHARAGPRRVTRHRHVAAVLEPAVVGLRQQLTRALDLMGADVPARM